MIQFLGKVWCSHTERDSQTTCIFLDLAVVLVVNLQCYPQEISATSDSLPVEGVSTYKIPQERE